ncbi:glutathione binding-like protein [Hyphococcus luteus]|uniref:Glutathione S-transferase n=1 Tax=Hyphococcus luteus TaxID=2058213 RepID=A0A2S7K372_9PROT|nr:glutathione binding-like protein [Marinicaulis flavus]PQA86952.1 glutathione S-transferase [Marinicaulis flavus]
MSIDLYMWPTGNGYKILIMLEECGFDYELKWVNIFEGDQFKEDFLKISPNNKMPAIVDHGAPCGEPLSIFEFGAILQYLGRKVGKFYPQDEKSRVETDQWLFWQTSGFGPMAGQAHHFIHYMKDKIPYAVERFSKETNRLYGVMDKRLADRDFLAGDYSIADMAAFPWARRHDWQGVDLDDYPNVKAWFDRIEARDAVRGALAIVPDKT